MSMDYAEITYVGQDGLDHTQAVESEYGVHMQLVLDRMAFAEERGAHAINATLGYGAQEYVLTADELRAVLLGNADLEEYAA